MSNENLNGARCAKNDEFYTLMPDITAELQHYFSELKGKKVYCNCDNPEKSDFYKFFVQYFDVIGLNELYCSYYNPGGKSYLTRRHRAGSILYYEDILLQDDGDFRSQECLDILDKCDVVVTNPPFSLFREFVKVLMEHKKQFLIIGTVNCVTYKDFFPYLKSDLVWPGCTFNKTMEFIMPDSYVLKGKAYVDDAGRKHGFVPGVCWFTNLDVLKRHVPLDLNCSYYDNPEYYPKYDNYDAIECSRVLDIPYDYEGAMGVPVTFLDRYNPEQFEILGLSSTIGAKIPDDTPKSMKGGVRFYLRDINGMLYKRCYERLVIRKR